MPPPTVVCYVSGHGFGHASRQIAILRALRARRPDAAIVVKTAAPAWFFERALTPPVSLLPTETDTGVVQVDSLRVDVTASIDHADRFHRALDTRADTEARALDALGASLVVGDIPPLACLAGARAAVPAIAIGNFTWDWIYAGYPETATRAPALVPTLRAAYATATEAWRLPLSGGFEAFDRVEDVPLVARRAARAPADVRHRTRLPSDRRLALFAFGRYGIGGVDWQRLARLDRYQIVFTANADGGGGPEGAAFTTLDEDRLRADGIGFEDLVGAVDVVITKPGYGLVAECAANDTAMLYTTRGRFPEYQVLVDGMPSLIRAARIDHDDLFAGAWEPHLDRLLAAPRPAGGRLDGADVIATRLAARL